MPINRASIAKELTPGLNEVFGLDYGMVDNEHIPLFEIEKSQRAFEEELSFTGFGAAPTKDEGEAVAYDDAAEGYLSRYTAETIALAFAITEEAMEDNLYDSFAKIRAKALGRSMAHTKQVKAAAVFNNAFATSGYDGGDGESLIGSDHPTLSGKQTNTAGATDLSETAIENAQIAIAKFKDERGILIGASPVSLHIPVDLGFTAEEILHSPGTLNETSGNTAANNINPVRSRGVIPRGYFINRRFTDTNAWFIRTDVPNGTKMFVRVPVQTKMEGDFDTGNMRYKARERYAFGWSDWRQWYGGSGSS